MPYPYGMQNAPVVGNGLGGLPRRTTTATTQTQDVWVATGSPITVSTNYTRMDITSSSAQICVMPDDGSVFITHSNGTTFAIRTLKCTEAGLTNKHTEFTGADSFTWAYVGSYNYPIVAVGPVVYSRNFGGSMGNFNTDTATEVPSITWNNGGTGYSPTFLRSFAYDPVGGVGMAVGYNSNNPDSKVITFNPTTNTTIAVSSAGTVSNNYLNGGAAIVSGGKYFNVYQTAGTDGTASGSALQCNTDFSSQAVANFFAYPSGGITNVDMTAYPVKLTTGPNLYFVRILSGRIRNSTAPTSASGLYSGATTRGPYGEFRKTNMANSFLGFQTSMREICIGSEVMTPYLTSTGTLNWVNYYNGYPVTNPPVLANNAFILRINDSYGVSFISGGSSFQMYKIIQQAI